MQYKKHKILERDAENEYINEMFALNEAKKVGEESDKKLHAIFQCKVCDNAFPSRSALSHHSYKHNNNKMFKCNFTNCGQAYQNPKRLSEHKQRTHFQREHFLCELCGYKTKYSHNLLTHARTHPPYEKPYCCDKCGLLFTSLSQLNEHHRIHKEESKFVVSSKSVHRCPECKFIFSSSKTLYHHKKLHLLDKSYVCNMCGAAYSQAAGLSQHYKWHKIQNKKYFASMMRYDSN